MSTWAAGSLCFFCQFTAIPRSLSQRRDFLSEYTHLQTVCCRSFIHCTHMKPQRSFQLCTCSFALLELIQADKCANVSSPITATELCAGLSGSPAVLASASRMGFHVETTPVLALAPFVTFVQLQQKGIS
jgi:hypothetical protein